jgi:predicted histidine transporter YuiF (NhaC family)|tara:strand:+ start:692 stop:988 length:297 start_codon:yes stop_codon:yes gene_type:complete
MILFKTSLLNNLIVMKPTLVEYEKIFKKKQIPVEIEIKKPSLKISQIENYHFVFNIVGISIVIIGIIILYRRKSNKERNKRLHTQRIIQLYHDTNKFE